MNRLPIALILSFVSLSLLGSSLPAADFKLASDDEGVTVELDGKLLTRYIFRSNNKPILWPIVGPTGKPVTRRHPMEPAAEGERADHPHHRSLWFTHGDVGGTSFWHEGGDAGTIAHRELVKVESGKQGTIITRNDWIGKDGETLCQDQRRVSFGVDGPTRWIDFDITVRATDKSVRFGDTKEGSFGVRVAGTMKVEAKPGGHIENSEGQTDGGAWGKQAAWVDYYGPVEGETVGIAILNHPDSFRYPSYWHVRTYGLFAANPFGLHHFKGDNKIDASHTLQPGESFTLNYRVLLHRGDTKQADIAGAFQRYAETDRPAAE